MMARAAAWMLLILIGAAAAWSGIVLRHDLWNWTMDIRFNGDIDNGFDWGKKCDHLGFFNVYDEMGSPAPGKEAIDYGPLRLGVMARWVQWLKPRYPDLSERRPDANFHAPLLWFNTAMEALTALSAGILTTHLIRRRPATLLASRRFSALPVGVLTGVVAGLLTWFDPHILWEGHTWPQWDIWCMPFYLFAIYCGCRRRWTTAGLLVGTGSMLKGQILMVGWTLPIWALLIGDWRGMFRFIFGTLCAIGVGGCVWELTVYVPGEHGFERTIAQRVSAGMSRAAARDASMRRIDWPAVAWVASWLAAAVLLPRRFSARAIVAALGISLLSTIWLFNGSMHWIESAYLMGTWHYPAMFMGTTSNLPAILKDMYGFERITHVCFRLDWPAIGLDNTPVTIKILLLSIYIFLCVLCAIFAAVNDRRRDPRLIIALTLPWLLFYVLPVQIHERYLLFFSACTAVLLAAGVRFFCLGLVVMAAGLIIVMHQSLSASNTPHGHHQTFPFWSWPHLNTLLFDTHPNIAWMLLLASAIFLYSIVPPTRVHRGID